jgi:hypothetical protein
MHSQILGKIISLVRKLQMHSQILGKIISLVRKLQKHVYILGKTPLIGETAGF